MAAAFNLSKVSVGGGGGGALLLELEELLEFICKSYMAL